MNLFKNDWTPRESDEWTIHDFVASTLSALSYFLATIGVAGSLLLQTWGFVTLAASLVLAFLMYKVIDPKLRTMSDAFEKKQKEYLENLERKVRWEVDDGD